MKIKSLRKNPDCQEFSLHQVINPLSIITPHTGVCKMREEIFSIISLFRSKYPAHAHSFGPDGVAYRGQVSSVQQEG